jgi:hypothetical protein
MLNQNLIGFFLSSSLLFSTAATAVEKKMKNTPIKDPETEIALAITDLDNLHKQLKTSKEITSRLGLGPQTVNADEAYKNALSFYANHEYLSVIRELNTFLNLTQVPKMKPYLRSQYLLGHSYEEIGFKSKALKAYFRYLAAFLTSKHSNYDELLHVMRKMLPLAALDSGKRRSELNELLSSITSLNLPKNVQPSVFYYAAKSAANAGHGKIADSWLQKAAKDGETPNLKARATYIKALLALSVQDYDKAEKLMGDIMIIDQKKGSNNRNLARLALARIAVHRKKHKLALHYYNLIPEKSEGFRDSLFESIYLHLGMGQDGEARTKAQLYLARYPHHNDAFKLKTLLAYLDLRAGNLNSASQGISSSNGELKDIKVWMRNSLTGKDKLTHSELTNFLSVAGPQVSPTGTVKEAYALFQRLAEVSRRLADARGEIRNINYTMGRAQIRHLNPFWINRAEQLSKIGEDLLRVGHRLSGAERHLYIDQINELDKYKLKHSEDRRTRLLSAPAHSHRRLKHWATYANFLNLTKEVSDTNTKLAKAKAALAAAKFLLKSKTGKKGVGSSVRDINAHEIKIASLNENLNRTLELLRTQKVQDLVNQSPHRYARKFISQYAVALNSEYEVLTKVRNHPTTTSQKLLSDDGKKAWKHWKHLVKMTFEQLSDLDNDVKNSLTMLIGNLTDHEDDYLELADNMRALTDSLEAEVGGSLAYIVDQYGQAINRRMSRNRKWRADVEWLKYTNSVSKKQKMLSRFDLEKQILNDNLSDLEQGALWQWPQ